VHTGATEGRARRGSAHDRFLPSSPAPEDPLSASGAPNLPEEFNDTFTSRYVEAGDVRLHWVAEQAPDELLAELTEFLAPYKAGATAAAGAAR